MNIKLGWGIVPAGIVAVWGLVPAAYYLGLRYPRSQDAQSGQASSLERKVEQQGLPDSGLSTTVSEGVSVVKRMETIPESFNRFAGAPDDYLDRKVGFELRVPNPKPGYLDPLPIPLFEGLIEEGYSFTIDRLADSKHIMETLRIHYSREGDIGPAVSVTIYDSDHNGVPSKVDISGTNINSTQIHIYCNKQGDLAYMTGRWELGYGAHGFAIDQTPAIDGKTARELYGLFAGKYSELRESMAIDRRIAAHPSQLETVAVEHQPI